MKTPFFSIVIPTKNRAALVRVAIESLLQQTFPDIEIILTDNDDTDATEQVFREFDDPRLRWLRTGNHSMPDNWERGCAEAKGEYICVLEDKQSVKRRAFERLHSLFEKHRPQSAKWRCDAILDNQVPTRVRILPPAEKEPDMVASDEILDAFCRDPSVTYKQTLPLPQFSAFHKDLAARVRNGPMGRLFHAVSPDVILGFLQLNETDAILDVPEAHYLYSSLRASNGASFTVRGPLFRQFQSELGGGDSLFHEHTPVKSISVPCSVYNDFLRTRDRAGGRLADHELCWAKFFVDTQVAIWEVAFQDVDVSADQSSWDEAFKKLPTETQKDIEARLEKLRHKRGPESFAVRRRSERLGLKRFWKQCQAFMRGRVLGDPRWRLNDPREFLAWEAKQPAPWDQG